MSDSRIFEIKDPSTGLHAYLAINTRQNGISFGGTRIDPSVTKEVVAELAEAMTLKLAGHGSPVGGAKAGFVGSPHDPRLKTWLKQFALEFRQELSTATILGKDMGAEQWMLDEIYNALGIPQLWVMQKQNGAPVPSRPAQLNGYIPHMTGKGVFWALRRALGGEVRGARVLIQGCGIVGLGAAWHLHQAGALVIGMNDREKAVLFPRGVAAEILMAAVSTNRTLVVDRLPADCSVIDRDKLLEQDADVVVLAAGSHVVDEGLAGKIRSRLVVEGANFALRPAARECLHARATRVVPDVIASSSSAALVGHQIAAHNALDPDQLWKEIQLNIEHNTDAVHAQSKDLNLNSRETFRRLVRPETRTGAFLPAGR